MLRIGTFARLGGVSAKTLRDYAALRLFRPGWVDPATGYRAYSPAQLPELRRILALREMGVGLDEIGRLVSGGAHLGAVLERRRGELEQERRELDRRLAALDIRVEMAAAGSDAPDVVVRNVAAEPVAGPAGEGGIASVEVFVPVREPLRPRGRIGYRRLPACTAATIIHHGSYATLGATRSALHGWIASAGLHPVGGLRILYLQFGAEPELVLPRDYLVERAADFVTELQVPVA